MTNPLYGEVIFSSEKKYSIGWIEQRRNYVGKKDIRNRYNLEIGSILNGYRERYKPSLKESYLRAFNNIKGSYSEGTNGCNLDWLKSKKVKKIIKRWYGDPFDLLEFLTCNGHIEKAVRQKYKRTMGK
jgi:hypothetical protein